MEKKISVVIPVYNVAEYIAHCIETLKAQKLDGLEFIFVDDCSTDQSVKIIEAFAAEDDRVRLIRNAENLGPGGTRNAGIRVAKGDYLSFVDPDDWISENFYSLLYAKAQQCGSDITKGKTVCINEQTGQTVVWWEKLNKEIQKKLNAGKPLFLTPFYDHYAAIYKRELFLDGRVAYGTSRNGEDATFILKVSCYTQNIAFENDAVYFYRLNRDGNASGNYTRKRVQNELLSLEEKIDFLRTQQMTDDHYTYIGNRINHFMIHYCLAAKNSPDIKAMEDFISQELFRRIHVFSDYVQNGEMPKNVKALIQYGKMIPGFHRELFPERITRWTDCLLEHPEDRTFYTSTYAYVILEGLFNYVKPENNRLRQSKFLRILWKQLHRLDGKYRLHVYFWIIKISILTLRGKLRYKLFGEKKTGSSSSQDAQ